MIDYRLDFHSTPVIRHAHWFDDRDFKMRHTIDPAYIEFTYTLQGTSYAQVDNGPFETVPPNSLLVEIFDKPNYMVCHEYFQHISIVFKCHFSYVSEGGVLLPRLLTFDSAANPVRELVDKLVLHHSMTPNSSLPIANLWELIGKVSAIACEKQNNEPNYGKQWYVYRAKKFIVENMISSLRVVDVAQHLGISEGYLSHIFREVEGMSIISYANSVRIKRIEQYILLEGLDVRQASLRVGFKDPAYVSRLFRKIQGYSITELRRTASGKPVINPD